MYATLAVWLNPAMILAGPILGYLDPLMALPAIGAILAAVEGRALVAGALFALACLTKAQAVFIGPVVALATWNAAPARRSARVAGGLCGFGAVTAAAVAPYVAVGAGRNMRRGSARSGSSPQPR